MTPDEKFYEILNKYEYRGVEPLQLWSTDDLIDLVSVLTAELNERDRQAQEQYFDQQSEEIGDEMGFDAGEDFSVDDEDDTWYEDLDGPCEDPTCTLCHPESFEDEGSYGGTDPE